MFSAILCGLKIGLAIGGALVAAILAAGDYDPNQAVQTAGAVHNIRLAVSLYSSIPFLLCVGLLFFYEIDRRTEVRIEAELAARRAA